MCCDSSIWSESWLSLSGWSNLRNTHTFDRFLFYSLLNQTLFLIRCVITEGSSRLCVGFLKSLIVSVFRRCTVQISERLSLLRRRSIRWLITHCPASISYTPQTWDGKWPYSVQIQSDLIKVSTLSLSVNRNQTEISQIKHSRDITEEISKYKLFIFNIAPLCWKQLNHKSMTLVFILFKHVNIS